jgi:prolipoprotein diacylglyceryltransferase
MEPQLPLSIWFALFFVLGVAVGWWIAIKRRR